MTRITVGMADLKVGRDGDVLVTLGLGSCIGVTLYDPVNRIGGMAHFMLPQQGGVASGNRAKFADTAMEDLYRRMLTTGAVASRLQAKMAGGAHMFSRAMDKDVIRVGERNADACKEILKKMKIPLNAQDTGGTYGRTIELNTLNGSLLIRTIGHGIKTV